MNAHRRIALNDRFAVSLSRRSILKLLGAGIAVGIADSTAAPVGFTHAQSATPAAGTPVTRNVPEVAITAEDYRFGVDATLPTGYVRLTMVNKSTESTHHAMFMRPNEGVSPTQFITKAKATANYLDLLSLAKSAGGPGSVSPGRRSSVIMNLEEGPYVLICVIPGPDGTPHYQMGMMSAVAAKASGAAVSQPPTPEASIDLADFSFLHVPPTVPAGQPVWKGTNTGEQVHELVAYKLARGVTSADAFQILTALVSPPATPGAATPVMAASPSATPVAATPPLVDVNGIAPMSPGETDFLVLDVTPGNYVLACFVTDPATGKPHIMLGMYGAFTVT